jgi:hypothetical protein
MIDFQGLFFWVQGPLIGNIQLFNLLKIEDHTTRITPERQKKFHSTQDFLHLQISIIKKRRDTASRGREGGMKWAARQIEVEGVGGSSEVRQERKVGTQFWPKNDQRKTGREGYARDEER